MLRSSSADLTTKRKNMNKLAKLVFAASAVVSLSASAADYMAKTPTSGYLQDSRGATAGRSMVLMAGAAESIVPSP